MKKIVLIILALSTLGFLKSQNITYPTPDFSNQIYFYDSAVKDLTLLERVAPQERYKLNVLNPVPRKPRVQLTIDGKKSSFRIGSNQPKAFLLKLSPDVDPSLYYHLTRINVVGKNRVATLYKIRDGIHGTKRESTGDDDLSKYIKLKKVSNDVFLITINKDLERGEYSFYYCDFDPDAFPTICFAFGIN